MTCEEPRSKRMRGKKKKKKKEEREKKGKYGRRARFKRECIIEYRDDARQALPGKKKEKKKRKRKRKKRKKKVAAREWGPRGKVSRGNSISEIVLSAVSAKRQSEL